MEFRAMPTARNTVAYRSVRSMILDGSLLLWRGRGLIARVIQIAGRSVYSHAGMAMWHRDTLLSLEIREFVGGRAVTLASQVRRFPGQIDVFLPVGPSGLKPHPANVYDGTAAAEVMLRKAGNDYSYWGLAAASVQHLPIVRWWSKPDMNDGGKPGIKPEFCSQAVASAARIGGGVDPVPNLSDRTTEPGDLARSQLWSYRWTLRP